MVRVTHPPGGAPKFQSQTTAPCPKTVRVLKPPGGGSSISFGDDPIVAPKKAAPKPVEEPVPEVAASEEQPAAEPETPAAETEETPSNGTSAVTEEAAPEASEESPKATEEPKTNGTAHEDSSVVNGSDRDSYSRSNSKVEADDFPKVSFENEKQEQPTEAPASPPSQNGHAEDAPSAPPADKSNAPEVPSDTVQQNGAVNGHCNGAVTETPVVNGSEAPATTDGTVEAVETKESTPQKPPAPVRSNSNGLASEESTKPSAGRPMPSNHHMKSSIFIEEETHNFIAPPKKSVPSPVKEKPAPFAQERPQRVRQPPGGFSSQLW